MCFEENFICHQSLVKVAESPQPEWERDILILAGGILSGMVIDYQMHHR